MEFSAAELKPMIERREKMFQDIVKMGLNPHDPKYALQRTNMERKFIKDLYRMAASFVAPRNRQPSSGAPSPQPRELPYETELKLDIHSLHSLKSSLKNEAVIKEVMELRKQHDRDRIVELIETKSLNLWDVHLALTGRMGEFHVDQAQLPNCYKLSLHQTFESLFGQLVNYPFLPPAFCGGRLKIVQAKYLNMLEEFASEPLEPNSIRATHLLASYSNVEGRLSQLAAAIKEWKRRRFDLLDKAGAFSSYAFMLMLIYYLQRGCQPPVLPCLHEDYPDVFGSQQDTSTLRDAKIAFDSKNELRTEQLFVGFFEFYSHDRGDGFNYRKTKVSIRSSGSISFNPAGSSMFVIEDPITQKNVVKNVPYSGPANYGKLTKLETGNMSEILTEMFALMTDHLTSRPALHSILNYNYDD